MFESSDETAVFEYFKPFEARFTVRVLHEFHDGIFDFGAGYTVYKDETLFSMLKSAFMSYENVILLRYSDDANESFEALRNRHIGIPEKLYNVLNAEFINSPCNEILAKRIIDTKCLIVIEIADIISPHVCI